MKEKRAPNGYRCGESHQRSRLTNEQVENMRKMREEKNIPYSKLGEIFNCAWQTADSICNYRSRIYG